MTYAVMVGSRYFSARRGYLGGLTSRRNASLFSLQDAINCANRIADAVWVEVPNEMH